MSDPVTIWQGTVSALAGGAPAVTFTLDPSAGTVTQAATFGPIQFTPDPGYADLTGAFSSVITYDPGNPPASPAGAWEQSAAALIILDPAKTYTMTITQT